MLTIEFHLARETKNNLRYEVSPSSPYLGTIYVPKEDAKEMGNPKVLVAQLAVPAAA